MEGSKAAKTVAKPIRLPPPRQRSLHSHLTGATESPVLSLPRLPVPKLEDTLTKYLASLEPFLLEDAENGGPPLDTARRKHRELADKFMKGVGSRCQRELQDFDSRSPNNWLDDNFWMKRAYLQWRAPLVVNSNWWLALNNDPTLSISAPHEAPQQINPLQVRRTAWILHRFLDFKYRLESQELYPQTTRTGIWLRYAALKAFDSCRSPGLGCDKMITIPPHSHHRPHKVLVMIYDWFYLLDTYPVIEDSASPGFTSSSPTPTPLSPSALEDRLRAIVMDAQWRQQSGERATHVGVLSADDRDKWAQNMQYLLSISSHNCSLLEKIQHSILAISLDDWTYPHLPVRDDAPPAPKFGTEEAPKEFDAHLHNTRSSHAARNRWFDKSLTIVVESNTRVGVMGEHAPVDALVPSMIGEYAVVENIDPSSFSTSEPKPFTSASASSTAPAARDGWERLDFDTDDHIHSEIVAAQSRAQKIIDDSDDSVMWFNDYGIDWIKQTTNMSSDAYIQMALQLAWYRHQKYFTATYETALTRLFRHGRTETIRTLSSDSRAFVLGMLDSHASVDDKIELLRRAVGTHEKLTRQAATGKGIDRHLFGLSCMPSAQDCDFFRDSLFARSQEWKLSTSALGNGDLFCGTGFGTPYHDGYGINYIARPDVIKFGVESKFSSSSTSTSAFLQEITSALQDMHDLFTIPSTSSYTPAHL